MKQTLKSDHVDVTLVLEGDYVVAYITRIGDARRRPGSTTAVAKVSSLFITNDATQQAFVELLRNIAAAIELTMDPTDQTKH